jgi:hypothetical protein
MSAELKIQKEVKGSALIDLGRSGTLSFDAVTVYTNGWDEEDMVMLIVDKNDPEHKIQLTFSKPVKEETITPESHA